MGQLNILFICHRFPFPPKRGGKIRPFNIIKHLSNKHRVTVASLVRSPEEAKDGDGIVTHCAAYEMGKVWNPVQVMRMIGCLATTTPSSMGFFYSRHLAHRINELLQNETFDLIFVHCSSVAQYVEDVHSIPKILDFGDMDSQKWLEYSSYKTAPLSFGYWLEGMKLLRAEKLLAGKFDFGTATTRAELETLDGYQTSVATDWFPNGVDTEYFCPSDEPYNPNVIVFVGRMDYYPNQQCMLDFCANVLPIVRARRPDVQLKIVGADPSVNIRKLGMLPSVSVTGSVPDVRPYLRQAALSVAPLKIARGTQNKILEAMAVGVPVITTSVAARGVDAVAPEHFLVADSISEQVDAIFRVLDSVSERERLSGAGRQRMLTHHQWGQSMERMDTIIHRVLGSRRANGV